MYSLEGVIGGIVRLYYYGFLDNEDIGLIFVIRHSIHLLLVYYIIRMSTQPLLLYVILLFFFFLYLNHSSLYKVLSYHSHNIWYFILLILWFICTYQCICILLLQSCFGCPLYSFIEHYIIVILC